MHVVGVKNKELEPVKGCFAGARGRLRACGVLYKGPRGSRASAKTEGC